MRKLHHKLKVYKNASFYRDQKHSAKFVFTSLQIFILNTETFVNIIFLYMHLKCYFGSKKGEGLVFSEKYFSTDEMYRQAKTLKITPFPYFFLDIHVYFTYSVLVSEK